jgi:hypothetical protein
MDYSEFVKQIKSHVPAQEHAIIQLEKQLIMLEESKKKFAKALREIGETQKSLESALRTLTCAILRVEKR